MSNLEELIRQKAELERKISIAQSESRSNAIGQIRKLMDQHGLTTADLASTGKRAIARSTTGRKPVAVKYRDQSGNQWTGRGLKPKWLTEALSRGQKLEDFAV